MIGMYENTNTVLVVYTSNYGSTSKYGKIWQNMWSKTFLFYLGSWETCYFYSKLRNLHTISLYNYYLSLGSNYRYGIYIVNQYILWSVHPLNGIYSFCETIFYNATLIVFFIFLCEQTIFHLVYVISLSHL